MVDSKVEDFLNSIQECMDLAEKNYVEKRKEDARKARKAIGNESDVLFNFRVNKGLRDEFERLCKANHTNMSREVKKFMTLAVKAQKLT